MSQGEVVRPPHRVPSGTRPAGTSGASGKEWLRDFSGLLAGERGSVTLGHFSPTREQQTASSRITPLLILASAAILLVGLGVNRLTLQSVSVPVSVDASPFASVRIVDARQEVLLQKDTPFVTALAPGEYSFQFSYGSGTVTKAVRVSPDRTPLVRHQFWTGDEVDSLVGHFLASGDQR